MSYDGEFRALTDSTTLRLDDATQAVSMQATDSVTRAQQQQFQALVQQYYTRIERKNFTADD